MEYKFAPETEQRETHLLYHVDMRICLNAALLSGQQLDYRAAGISHYQNHSLRALAAAAPADWQLDAWVSPEVSPDEYPDIHLHHAAWSLRRPLARILWEQLLLPGKLRGADLFHAMAFVAPAFLRCPQVLTIYDLSFFREPEYVPAARRHYLRHATRWSAQRARRILTISSAVASDIEKYLGITGQKIDIAYPGVDRDRFRPLPVEEVVAFRKEKSLPERYWLFIGTLEPRKNLVTLLEAYAELNRSQRLPLILAGGAGWGIAEIQSCIERWQLGDSVFLPGYVSAADLPLWYNGANWFIYPSVHEGFGMPVLEAMACGVPTLTSEAQALSELMADPEYCIATRDPAAWSAALKRAATDDEWPERARSHSIARAADFSWENTAERIIASYRAALA